MITRFLGVIPVVALLAFAASTPVLAQAGSGAMTSATPAERVVQPTAMEPAAMAPARATRHRRARHARQHRAARHMAAPMTAPADTSK